MKADAQRKHGDAWMYRFEFLSRFAKETGMLVTHAFELPCVFAVKEHEFAKVFFEGETDGVADKIIDDMHRPWVNFIKRGDPEGGAWPKFTGFDSPVKVFDHDMRVEQMDRREMMRVWGDMRFYEG